MVRKKKYENKRGKMKLRSTVRRILCTALAVATGCAAVFAGMQLPVQEAEAALFYEEGPMTYAQSYCVMDADTGEIICAHNATAQYYPASITKVLTALIVIENTPDLSVSMSYSKDAVTNVTSDSSTMNPAPKEGEMISVENALYGLLLSSCNISANALAEKVAGSTPAFADMMNAKAAEIGTLNSHFVNAHGLQDPNHYTCAYDMALIFRTALQNETFAKIDSTDYYTIPATNMCDARKLEMGHRMINGTVPYEGVYAGKTGRTPVAGRTLLTAAEHNGRHIVISLMKSNDDRFYDDAKTLLDYAYGVIDGKEHWYWNETDDVYVTATGNVNMRELPTVHSTSLGTFGSGTVAKELRFNADWAELQREDGKIFYVATSYLTPTVDPGWEETEETSEDETETESESEDESETETESESETETESESGTEAEMTVTPTVTPTSTPTATPTPTPTLTVTPTPTVTDTPVPTVTPSPAPTDTPAVTSEPEQMSSGTQEITPSATPAMTQTDSTNAPGGDVGDGSKTLGEKWKNLDSGTRILVILISILIVIILIVMITAIVAYAKNRSRYRKNALRQRRNLGKHFPMGREDDDF